MKNLFYLFLSTSMLSFAACQKDSDPVNPTANEARIKTETYHGVVDNYAYDERGRIIRGIYPDGAKDTVQYYKGYFIEKEYDPQGNLKNLNHYELNADSLVEIYTSTAQPEYETRYEYDSLHRRIKASSTSPGDLFVIDYFYGPEGNQDSSVVSRNGARLYTYEYSYLEHQPNVYTRKTYGRVYFGEESKNLLAGAYYRFPNPENNDVIQYDYVFDTQGRIITMTERINGISEQSNYTYQ